LVRTFFSCEAAMNDGQALSRFTASLADNWNSTSVCRCRTAPMLVPARA
jgi:hypothetical protein